MIGETLSGRYEVERLLGRGGMSAVWLARDTQLPRFVAVKMLHARRLESEEAVERFEREARTLAALAHPGIVMVIDRGEHDGRPFIVFEYVHGQDLRARIAERGQLDVVEALAICAQIADALGYAHRHGVIHRDVKPHNVLLTDDGVAKLSDFGIARILEQPSLTSAGRVLGTGEYIAPEQASGQPLDERADVYGLGGMLYHCLTGETPYAGRNFVELAQQHLHAPVPSPQSVRSDVDDDVDAVVRRALAKDPDERYPTCAALGADLDRLLQERAPAGRSGGAAAAEAVTAIAPAVVAHARHDDEPTPTHSTPRPVPSARARRRRPSGVGVLSLAALLAVGAAVAVLLGSDQSDPTGATTTTRAGSVTTTATAATGAVAVAAIPFQTTSTFDPNGDGSENSATAQNAIDGTDATSWSTERYRGSIDVNHKGGVGIVLETADPVHATRLQLDTPAPGWIARIYASDADTPPATLAGWRPASRPFTMTSTQRSIALDAAHARRFLVWITQLSGPSGSWSASISEARLFGPHAS